MTEFFAARDKSRIPSYCLHCNQQTWNKFNQPRNQGTQLSYQNVKNLIFIEGKCTTILLCDTVVDKSVRKHRALRE